MSVREKLIEFARERSLKGKVADPFLTGIEPLDSIKKIAIFFDADQPASIQLISQIKEYFNKKGKEIVIFAVSMGEQMFNEGMQRAVFLHREDFNWYGKIKAGRKYYPVDVGEDMFISLFKEDTFAIEYAARCSKARFKVGRRQLSDNVYDLVLNEREDRPQDQATAFRSMMNFIEKIQY